MGSRLLYHAADYAERRLIRVLMVLSSIKNNFYFACGFVLGRSGVGNINLFGSTVSVRRACAGIRVRKSVNPTFRDRYLPGKYQ